MGTKKVMGEGAFQVLAHSFSVYTPDAFTIAYSTDGEHFTNYEESTPAGETLIVNGVAKNMYFKLVGNTAEAIITY